MWVFRKGVEPKSSLGSRSLFTVGTKGGPSSGRSEPVRRRSARVLRRRRCAAHIADVFLRERGFLVSALYHLICVVFTLCYYPVLSLTLFGIRLHVLCAGWDSPELRVVAIEPEQQQTKFSMHIHSSLSIEARSTSPDMLFNRPKDRHFLTYSTPPPSWLPLPRLLRAI